jgi:2-C-methyl-D-erythritol 2,4-cyclodiphosphate synthase
MINSRIGHGYDIHRLVPGRKLILGGVEIQYELGLDGHSDADVICHAIMDSILGALALGDIGRHFPNTDPGYKGADSIELLKHVGGLLAEKKYRIGNIDVTVIAEKPKLMPYIVEMRGKISNVLAISLDNISIKATTNEMLGSLGRGEGIAAFAVALIYQ